jgi:hypothetical protein
MRSLALGLAMAATLLAVGCNKPKQTSGSGSGSAAAPAPSAPSAGACAAGFTKAPSGGVCLKLGATCKFADQTPGDKESHSSNWNCETPDGGGEVTYNDVWDMAFCLKNTEELVHASGRQFIATGDLPNNAGKWFSYKQNDRLGIRACAKSSSPNGSYLINCDASNGGGGEASVESVKSLLMLAN